MHGFNCVQIISIYPKSPLANVIDHAKLDAYQHEDVYKSRGVIAHD